jgi:outer membrane lipoprotein-sorting protein
MNSDSHKNEEDRFSEMIATADKDTPQPDRAFLAGLKTESTRRFLETASSPTISERDAIMTRVKRIALGAIAACVVGAIGVAFVFLETNKPGIVWADVQKHIEQAKCMKTKIVLTMPDGTTMHGRQMMAAGGLIRQEMSVKTGQKTMEMVMIMNMDKGIILNLFKAQKLAQPMKFTDMPKAMRDKMVKDNDHLAEIKRMVRNAEKELGEKTIDGVKTKGFQVKDDDVVLDIWVDAKTALPVRMEGEMIGAKMKFVMSDVEFVKTVDMNLFSVEPPKGYTIQPQSTVSLKPAGIKDIADMFKAWTQIRSGTFPEAINPVVFMEDAKAHAQKLKDAGDTPEEFSALIKHLSQQMVSAMMLAQSNETFHYQGKGVKLGDKNTAILRYKPHGQDKYVVMFGDLNVKRMLENDLPKTSTEKVK